MSQLHEQAAMSSAYISQQDRAQRSAEAWTETLEAWAARLDAAKNDADAVESLCADLDGEFGQNRAWSLCCTLHFCLTKCKPTCAGRPHLVTAARDAILAVPMPEAE